MDIPGGSGAFRVLVPEDQHVGDRIVLSGMTFFGHQGVLAEERKAGQVFIVDLLVEADLHRAGHTDDLADILDYRDLYTRVCDVVTGGPLAYAAVEVQRRRP
ncbi:MAG TPA: dihydroneopterin aldolase [bacterium]|nr:dihydroneopterin aldolase [bacterium]